MDTYPICTSQQVLDAAKVQDDVPAIGTWFHGVIVATGKANPELVIHLSTGPHLTYDQAVEAVNNYTTDLGAWDIAATVLESHTVLTFHPVEAWS